VNSSSSPLIMVDDPPICRQVGELPANEWAMVQGRVCYVCCDVFVTSLATQRPRVLLLRRKGGQADGQWWCAGGRLQKGEELRHCVTRHTARETGIPLEPWDPLSLLGVGRTAFADPPPSGVDTVNLAFHVLCLPDGRNPRVALDEYHSYFTWASETDLGSLQLHQYIDAFSRLALRRASQPR
jgi:ADP-ribose pyrophosphatase YjhB (NUDIX family)